jgi:hypothetical protein
MYVSWRPFTSMPQESTLGWAKIGPIGCPACQRTALHTFLNSLPVFSLQRFQLQSGPAGHDGKTALAFIVD